MLALAPHLSLAIIARILLGFGTCLNTANCSLLVAQYRYKSQKCKLLRTSSIKVMQAEEEVFFHSLH